MHVDVLFESAAGDKGFGEEMAVGWHLIFIMWSLCRRAREDPLMGLSTQIVK